jgi:hypothetical protein
MDDDLNNFLDKISFVERLVVFGAIFFSRLDGTKHYQPFLSTKDNLSKKLFKSHRPSLWVYKNK